MAKNTSFVLKGQIVEALSAAELTIHQDSYLIIENSLVQGVFGTIPVAYSDLPIEDYGDNLIIPAPCDLHLHAPQFSYAGMGTDLQLLPWLEKYTFPEESRYADLTYAQQVYSRFADELLRQGTLRACVFATIHREATLILMDELEKRGICAYVGKVNMDFNAPDYLRETTEQSLSETRQWLEDAKRFTQVKPIITPRFIPSCSHALLTGLGALAQEFAVPIQSHLSENRDEIKMVQAMYPHQTYTGAYDEAQLLNHRTVMAHCVYLTMEERLLIKKRHAFIAHCPESNMNVSSGLAPVRQYLHDGLKIGLASDIAGGSNLNMLRVMAMAIQSSKLKAIYEPECSPFLTVSEAFWLGTSGGAEFFAAKPGFAVEEQLFALVLNDDNLQAGREKTVAERLERLFYRGDDRNIIARYSCGREV